MAVDRELVVLFDADCAFCLASVRWLRSHDPRGRLLFVSLQEAAVSRSEYLRHVAATHPLHEEIHVVDEATGRVVSGGRAMLEIFGALPFGAILRPVALVPPLVWVADLLYGLIARNRDALGRLIGLQPSCSVARPEQARTE